MTEPTPIQKLPPVTGPYMFIMQGLPGSGKSFWTVNATLLHPGAVVVSADDHEGLYMRDVSGKVVAVRSYLLGAAHGACFRAAVQAAQLRKTVIVDNTNTTVAEVSPYIMLAQAYGLQPIILRIQADPEVCAARNTHAVPRDVIYRLAEHLRQFTAPAHWKDIPGYAMRDLPGPGMTQPKQE